MNKQRTVASFGKEYQFVDSSQDVAEIKKHFAGSVRKFNSIYDDYGAFFVIVGDGDYDEVWGIEGNIPYNWKIAYLVEDVVDRGSSVSEANPRRIGYDHYSVQNEQYSINKNLYAINKLLYHYKKLYFMYEAKGNKQYMDALALMIQQLEEHKRIWQRLEM